MDNVIVIIGIVVVIAVIAAFLVTRRHPENAADHGSGETQTTSEQLYETADRPAGPDAEPMDPDRLGGDQDPPASG